MIEAGERANFMILNEHGEMVAIDLYAEDDDYMEQPKAALLTYDDFRKFVADKDGAFEYVDGFAVALASPSIPHSRLVTVIGNEIFNHLRGTRCDVHYSNDVLTDPNARRPDITVTCDEHDLSDDADVIRKPELLIEVLSGSTESADLKEKLAEYQSMPSVQEYVLVDSRKRWVRHFFRSIEGSFIFLHDYIGGKVRLTSINLVLDLDRAYEEARIK